MKNINRYLFIACRIIVGIVFIFSGFVKGIDPLGSAYKFSEYFNAAGLPSMNGLSLVLSFMLSAAEFLIGVALLLGLLIRFTSKVALIFIGFFTILTFILAVFNPVTDCGCFGDAVKLTNWATFYKNILFTALILYIFFNREKYSSSLKLSTQWVMACTALIFFECVSVYSYRHLPIIDFMPYSAGADIKEKMKKPAGAPQDVFKTRLFYKKDNKVKEFTPDNYPWQDTTWKWVQTKTELIKKGYVPPIHDFSITTMDGSDITDVVLNDTCYSFLFIANNLTKSDRKGLEFIRKIQEYCDTTFNSKIYVLTSSSLSEVDTIKSNLKANVNFYTTDETTLKTAIRSNPGIILIKDGIILRKWHYNDFAKIPLGKNHLLSEVLDNNRKESENTTTFAIFSSLSLIILLIYSVLEKFKKHI